jgi:hypothetical protein
MLSSVTVLPAGSTVAGRSIGEWSAEWWQWAVSFSAPTDPITDTTGANADLQQKGPVFFLAGPPGGSATKEFTVPRNKYLLVPLLVVEWSQLELGFDQTPAEIKQAASDTADQIDELHATIDGTPVTNLFDHREASSQFKFKSAANNPLVPAGNSPMWRSPTVPSPAAHCGWRRRRINQPDEQARRCGPNWGFCC